MVTEQDRKLMGTQEQAYDNLVEKTRDWRALRQPVMGTPKELRERDAAEREARFQLANAALLWLWHEENGVVAEQANP